MSGKPPLLLICGPKHCGKTSAGLALKEILGGDFVDVDALIEEREGLTARALYRRGRTLFQEAESRAVSSIAARAKEADGVLIAAAGGGLIDNEAAMETLAEDGRALIVYLEVSSAVAWRRIEEAAKNGGGLPAFLDTENPKAAHAALHERRAAAYRERAGITIDAEGKNPRQIAAQIAALVTEPGQSLKPFYRNGLRFSCRRCSFCCRAGPGFVFLSGDDLYNIAKKLDMPHHEFIQVYCRWIDWDGGARLSLKEKTSLDCIFWKDGCLIYEARPVQCRTYPFWESMLGSEEVWLCTTEECPGAGSGSLVSGEYIESCMELERSTRILTKKDLEYEWRIQVTE
ncbi:MAG: YkgJ family cysteine cluster protein [Spirochaetaceae bacterium]|nr:YkgJ family cysteine cluster protein [Spirochaetaceae bacterium]